MDIFELVCSSRSSDMHILKEQCGNKIGINGGEEEEEKLVEQILLWTPLLWRQSQDLWVYFFQMNIITPSLFVFIKVT